MDSLHLGDHLYDSSSILVFWVDCFVIKFGCILPNCWISPNHYKLLLSGHCFYSWSIDFGRQGQCRFCISICDSLHSVHSRPYCASILCKLCTNIVSDFWGYRGSHLSSVVSSHDRFHKNALFESLLLFGVGTYPLYVLPLDNLSTRHWFSSELALLLSCEAFRFYPPIILFPTGWIRQYMITFVMLS